jgi:hypothetical protein
LFVSSSPGRSTPEARRPAPPAVRRRGPVRISPVIRAGEAAHLWLFLEAATEAWIPRSFLRNACTKLGIRVPEIYPRQDLLTKEKPLGNLIRYPLWNKSHFADPENDWAEVDPLEALTGITRTSGAELKTLGLQLAMDMRPDPVIGDGRPHAKDGSYVLPERIQALLSDKNSMLAKRWSGDVTGLKDTSRSGIVHSICALLIQRYVPSWDIEAAARVWCDEHDYEKGERRDWIPRGIENAYNFVASRSNAAKNGEAVCIPYSKVTSRSVRWHWEPWIPRSAVTILDGDPGLGKSTVSLDVAARTSQGWAMPPAGGLCDKPSRVLILNAEDDPEATIRPRLDAMEANPANIIALEAIKHGDSEEPPVLPLDLELVEGLICEQGITLVIIDPLMAFLDGKIDAHRDQDVRRCLHRLKILAQRTSAAILVIRHLNKFVGGPALYRGGGSIGIVGAARSALIVGRNPNDPAQMVLACAKSNLAPMPRSLLYSLKSAGHVARIAWGGETELMADDILEHPTGRKKQSTSEQCADCIREIFEKSPVMESDELDKICTISGFSPNAIRDARRLAGVNVSRVGFGPGAQYQPLTDELHA